MCREVSFFYVYIKSPNPKKPQNDPHHTKIGENERNIKNKRNTFPSGDGLVSISIRHLTLSEKRAVN